jgi:hypothetical protein
MGRILIGSILGAIVFFVWGFIWWTALFLVVMPPTAMHDADAVRTVLRENLPETGVYWVPEMPIHGAEAPGPELDAAMEVWTQKHREGPLGMIMLTADGAEPMEPVVLVRGFVIEVIAALLASMLLWVACAGKGYVRRVAFVFGLGAFAAVSVHLVAWNFLYVPTAFTRFQVIDVLVGWLAAGLVIAAIVKRPAAAGR